MQTVKFFVLLVLLGSIGILGADVFYSTAAGGYWNNGDTWVGTGLTPGPDDDVFIYGPVYVPSWDEVDCHNLTVDGSAAELRNAASSHGTVNIGGNLALVNAGKILSTLNPYDYYLNVNLSGNFSQAGLCQPGIFKFAGSLEQHLSQSPGYSLAPYQFVDVTAGTTLYIDTDFAASSSHASNLVGWRSTASGHYNLSLGAAADLTYGTRALIWENFRNGTINNCTLEDIYIQSTGIIQNSYGVVLRDVVNQATICNASSSGGITLNLEGDFHNYGELKSYPDAYYGLEVTSSGQSWPLPTCLPHPYRYRRKIPVQLGGASFQCHCEHYGKLDRGNHPRRLGPAFLQLCADIRRHILIVRWHPGGFRPVSYRLQDK